MYVLYDLISEVSTREKLTIPTCIKTFYINHQNAEFHSVLVGISKTLNIYSIVYRHRLKLIRELIFILRRRLRFC